MIMSDWIRQRKIQDYVDSVLILANILNDLSVPLHLCFVESDLILFDFVTLFVLQRGILFIEYLWLRSVTMGNKSCYNRAHGINDNLGLRLFPDIKVAHKFNFCHETQE